jgi:uncharacterized membrane protein affecting hemolysin expression
MANNILILSLVIIVLVTLFLNYRHNKKINESKDLLIKSLLSNLGYNSVEAETERLSKEWRES